MKKLFYLFAAMSLLASCKADGPSVKEETTTLSVGLPSLGPKTVLGASVDGKRKVYWSDGDRISLNGTASNPLSGVGAKASSATFTFPGVLTAPFDLLYPASFYKDASTVTLPSTQEWFDGGFASGTAPMAGHMDTAGGSATISHLCAIIRLCVLKDAGVSASKLASVRFRGNDGEQITGDFAIDYSAGKLTSAAAGTGTELTVTLDKSLSESDSLEVFLVVPARSYASGFSITLEDEFHRSMTKVKSGATTLTAGKLTNMTWFTFVPSPVPTELTLADITAEAMAFDDFNVTGTVVNASGEPLEGVVVSDGLQCVRTNIDGSFRMQSAVPGTRFIFISTPSGYLPPVSGGIPRFYKALADVTPSGGVYDVGQFVLTPVANPDSFTILVTADPQPRATSLSLDNVAYRSTRACEALYQDLTETAAAISGRQVYGICLGDLVHEDMGLLDTYATALGTLGYPTFNVIGNHDYDLTAADDDAGAAKFESLFGPRNYSFNIGGIHFVVLDNLIMESSGGKLSGSYAQGLTDDIWTWLRADMAYIPASSTVMVCAHSPMFKQENGSERTNTANHGADYGALFDKYAEVHAWAGHTHSTFNYIYPSSHRHRRVEVHTLARSTGELWTNEYLANGTPRGFTVLNVDGGAVSSWHFHPTKYLKSSFHGTYGQPSYEYCDWTYVSNVAKMKDTGADLDESYQMHVYAPGVYETGMLYANIFLWDGKWELPKFTMAGDTPVEMTLVEDVNVTESARVGFDMADKEIKDFYYGNYPLLRSAGYTASQPGTPLTMFKVAAPASGTGTVSVTDRFGNVYSRTITW